MVSEKNRHCIEGPGTAEPGPAPMPDHRCTGADRSPQLAGSRCFVPRQVCLSHVNEMVLAGCSRFRPPDAVLFHHSLEIGSFQPHLPGRPGHIPVRTVQRLQDETLFDSADRFRPDLFFDLF